MARFTDSECLAILDRVQSNEATADELALQLACSNTTIYAAIGRALELRPLETGEEIAPAPEPHCLTCGGPCQNVMVCGRRERAMQQRAGRWPQ